MKRLVPTLGALVLLPALATVTISPVEVQRYQLMQDASPLGSPHPTREACIEAARQHTASRGANANYRCVLTLAFSTTVSADAPASPAARSGAAPAAAPQAVVSHMPTINRALIPPPNTGTSERRIGHTGEMAGKSDIGAFRTACDYSHMNNDDPILFPGQQGRSHLHVFFGNTGTDYRSTPESILKSGNSTCRGGIVNRSAYWVPAMIDTRDGRPIRPRESGFYYKTGYQGIKPAQVTTFPPGFRMIAGDGKSDRPQRFVSYACDGVRWQSSIPVCRTGQQVEMTVNFPQCWDGVNLTSPDGRSHVAYANGRGCPSGFPVALPEVSTIAIYPVENGSGPDSSTWRLSSDNYTGAPGGFSGHADWFHGWDQEVMDTWVKQVLQPSRDGNSHIVGDGRAIW